MPTFLMISRHSPENCGLYNEKAKKVFLAYMDKMDSWSKKYGIKVLASCSVPHEHLAVMVFEASFDAVQKLSMEPEAMAMGAYTTTEVKAALNREESLKLMR
jgi:hypothetical protein